MSATPTQYEILADEIRRDIEAVREKIARLDPEGDPLFENFVRAYVNVPIPFLQTAVAIVEQEDDLRALRKLDPKQGMDTLQFIEPFRHVHGDFLAVARRLKLMLMRRKARLAMEALELYAIIRSMARRDPRMAEHARNLQRDLGPRGPKKKKPSPDEI